MSTAHPGRHVRPPSRTHVEPLPAADRAASATESAPLTREQVLTTALAMIDESGVDSLSMRGLAHAVHRDPMRLYRFVDGKSALLDAVTELVLSAFVVPEVVDGAWEAALGTGARRYRAIAVSHPKVVPLLVTRPLGTPLAARPPATLSWVESLLELFLAAGFDETAAVHATRLYLGFLNGHILSETQERVDVPEAGDALLRLGVNHLNRREFPRIRQLAAPLVEYNGQDELEQGLAVLLAGLRTSLAASSDAAPPLRPEGDS